MKSIAFLTGPSGTGSSTALNAFEDMGFETIDNMPLELVPRLFSGPLLDNDLAISISPRTRGFSVDKIIEVIEKSKSQDGYEVSLLYLDSSDEILLRRYRETRRRHPSAQDGSPQSGITLEKDLLVQLKNRADFYIDTSDLSPHDLREEVERMFENALSKAMSVNIQSFSYKRGVPRGVDMVMDCRFLSNPHWDEFLREKTGEDQEVRDYIYNDDRYASFLTKLVEILAELLPAYNKEGKSHFTIGLGCSGGQHRSVCTAYDLSEKLRSMNWDIALRHRELERRKKG